MSAETRYDTYEADLWNRLSGLLPSAEDAENFRDCREIGRQEAGLWLLTQRLLEHRIAIGDTTRAEIEVLAEQWGERLARHYAMGQVLKPVRAPVADGRPRCSAAAAGDEPDDYANEADTGGECAGDQDLVQ